MPASQFDLPDDRFARICTVPAEYGQGDRSLLEVVRASGFAEFRGQFAPRELADYLRAKPAIVDQWIAYSEDKRTTEGWYLRPPYSIGRVARWSPPMHEVKHPDLAAACAAFIIAELGAILDRG